MQYLENSVKNPGWSLLLSKRFSNNLEVYRMFSNTLKRYKKLQIVQEGSGTYY